MECKCGGETTERQIVRNKNVVCEYQHCKGCGRQHITKGSYPEAVEALTSKE
jgi:hypothetical protein